VSPLRVHYLLRLEPGETPERRALDLAREQSVEIVEGAAPAAAEARSVGRVAALAPAADGRFRATIDFPEALVGGELPQLVNVLWGNVSLQRGVRLDRIEWPPALLARFGGPTHGVAGLRALCGISARRPLAATALKPVGLSAAELARRAAECARGGIDLVKDDHGVADQAWAPFRERVLRVAEAVGEANAATGGATLYAPNLTGPADRMEERLAVLAEAGVRAALVAPLLVGLDTVRALAARSGLLLVAHPTFALSPAAGDGGLAPEVLFGDLFRLAGADVVVFPNAGGRFPFTYGECRAIETRLGAAMGRLAPAALMLGGGVDRARLEEWIPRYGPDLVWLVGGSLYARDDVETAARELAACVRRVAPGEPEHEIGGVRAAT